MSGLFGKKQDAAQTVPPMQPTAPVTEGKEKYQMAFPEGAAFDGIKCDLPGNFSIIKSTITLKEYFKCGGNLHIDGGSVTVAQFIEVGGELSLSHTTVVTARIRAKKLVLRTVSLECDVEVDELILTAGSRIKGKVTARRVIHVMPDCCIDGSLEAPEVRFDPGSEIIGQVRIGKAAAASDSEVAQPEAVV